jgi:hypothetical protein
MYIVTTCRSSDGVLGLNGDSCLLTEDGALMTFDTEDDAKTALKEYNVDMDYISIKEYDPSGKEVR